MDRPAPLDRRETEDARVWFNETLRLDPENKHAAGALHGLEVTDDKIDRPDIVGEMTRALRAAVVETYRRRPPPNQRRLTLEGLGNLLGAHARFVAELAADQKPTWDRSELAGRSFEYFKEPGIKRLGDQLLRDRPERCTRRTRLRRRADRSR